MRRDLHEANRASWNEATRAHNSHKPTQGAFLREGGELLFDEDYELLGDLADKDVAHLMCNSGQDTLCLARRGARTVGVDISDVAIEAARSLSRASGIESAFERADVYDWLERAVSDGRRFDIVYASYGWSIWLSDLQRFVELSAAVLRPNGRLVLLEFHPYAMVLERDLSLRYPYFDPGQPLRFEEGVGDYVAQSGEALAPSGYADGEVGFQNPNPSYEFCWTVEDRIAAIGAAGLRLVTMREWSHANGCALFEGMVALPGAADGRKLTMPEGSPSLPLMLGLVGQKPAGFRMFQVDAFAERTFSGNPAAVCVLESEIDSLLMQRIASENNLSETAFIVPNHNGPGHYGIRWFTPTTEVPLCGHATLASAHVVLAHLESECERVAFDSASGVLTIERDQSGYRMSLPANPPRQVGLDSVEAQALIGALDCAVLEVWKADYWLALVSDEAAVRACAPRFAALRDVPPGEVIVTAPGDSPDVDFVSRFFAPGVGIDEDPVTGSAHCILTPFWGKRLGARPLTAHQVSKRHGVLGCEQIGDRVVLTGQCVTVLEGRFSA